MPTPNDFSDLRIAGTNPGSGEFGQCVNQPTGPYPGTNIVPSPTPSKQFSSDVNGDPKALATQATGVIAAHADLNEVYGLCQPAATLGSHPWLRDSKANPSEKEPGNASPDLADKVPFAEKG